MLNLRTGGKMAETIRGCSLVQIKFFTGSLEEIEAGLNAFYLQKNFSVKDAKENTKFFNDNLVAVFYIEKIPAK